MLNSPSALSEIATVFTDSAVTPFDDALPAAADSSAAPPQPAAATFHSRRATVLELRVRNHPGTLSHVAGLFSRRAFNLEAVLCVPETGDAACSRMLLLVAEEPRLEQVERQLAKLYDVLSITRRTDLDPNFFRWLAPAIPACAVS